MLLTISKPCTGSCGAWVKGEIDTATREFIHRFSFPRGAEVLVTQRTTEVEGVRLVTFAPMASEWRIPCPLCGKEIVIGQPDTVA